MKTGYLNRNSGNGGMLIPVEFVNGAKTLEAVKDSGKVFTLDAAGGAYSITYVHAMVWSIGSIISIGAVSSDWIRSFG